MQLSALFTSKGRGENVPFERSMLGRMTERARDASVTGRVARYLVIDDLMEGGRE